MPNLTEKTTLPYWRLKTFNEKLNATIGFLKQNWKPLFRANLLIAGPLFVFGIGLILYYSNIVMQNLSANPDDPNWQSFIGLFFSVFIGGFFYGISILAITIVSLEVVKVHHEKPDKLNDLGYIFKAARKRFPKMFGFMIIGVLANFLVSMVTQLATIPMAFIGALGALVIFPLYLFAHIAVYAHIYVIGPTAYYERHSASKTVQKGIELVKGRFWQTTGMYFGAKAIQTIIVNGLLIPIIGAIFGWLAYKDEYGGGTNLLTSSGQKYLFLLIMFLLFIYLFFNLFTNIFHVITGAVQYFTLREEKENNHLYQQIENFENL